MTQLDTKPVHEMSEPEDPSTKGDFARGERTMPASTEHPDFARGERTLPPEPEGPDYARGQRKE